MKEAPTLLENSLTKQALLRGLRENDWNTKYPDQIALMYGPRALGFAKNLIDLKYLLLEAECQQGLDRDKIALFFIKDVRPRIARIAEHAINKIRHRSELRLATTQKEEDAHKRRDAFDSENEAELLREALALSTQRLQRAETEERYSEYRFEYDREHEIHQKLVEEINQKYTPEEFDALVYVALSHGDEVFLGLLDDPELNTDKESVKIAYDVLLNAASFFPRGEWRQLFHQRTALFTL